MKEEYKILCQKAQNYMIANIKSSGIPLSQLAKMAGISTTTLRNLVNKKTTIHTPTLIKISKALNMSVDDLIGLKHLGLTPTKK
ncbi:MAG: helix-turn-helix transcriptional regulator [Clostridia bacterium]|nr:helix-turn-helix transcriptional regulator [Clostridia bacterium]